jgi:hypothetical protein
MSSRLADDPAVNPGRLVNASIILCKKPTRGVIKATRGVWALKSPPEMDHPTHTQAAFEQIKTIDRHLQSASAGCLHVVSRGSAASSNSLASLNSLISVRFSRNIVVEHPNNILRRQNKLEQNVCDSGCLKPPHQFQ